MKKTSTAGKDAYFCSELVAYCYKVMGLLPENISAG